MMNKVILIGNLGAAPELRQTQGGMSVLSLSLATKEQYKDKSSNEWKEITDWHKIVAWGISDKFAAIFSKGDLIAVEGKIRTSKYQDKSGKDCYKTEIIADKLKKLSGKSLPKEINKDSEGKTIFSSEFSGAFLKTPKNFDDDIPF
jgi:single-strand DNA-binding protein